MDYLPGIYVCTYFENLYIWWLFFCLFFIIKLFQQLSWMSKKPFLILLTSSMCIICKVWTINCGLLCVIRFLFFFFSFFFFLKKKIKSSAFMKYLPCTRLIPIHIQWSKIKLKGNAFSYFILVLLFSFC